MKMNIAHCLMAAAAFAAASASGAQEGPSLLTPPSHGAVKMLEITPSEGSPRNGEGDFVRLADGSILLAWSRFKEDGSKKKGGDWDDGAADIVAKTSRDGGLSWSEGFEVLVKSVAGNVMSVSFARLGSGRIAMFYMEKTGRFRDRLLVRFSDDEAVTWSEPICVTANFDDAYYVCNNSRAIVLSSGRIAVPVACHGRKEDGNMETSAALACAISDDGGVTWRQGAAVIARDESGARIVTQEPGLLELKDGRVMMWARTSSGCQYAGYSADGCETWGELGPTKLVGPCSPASIKRLKSGELMAVWNDHRTHEELRRDSPSRRAPLTLALSRDEGMTWSRGVDIEENLKGWYCYTAILECDGGVLLAYSAKQRRNLDTMRVTFVPDTSYRCATLDRPYEFEWAKRDKDEFPPIAPLEDAEGWSATAEDAEASAISASDHRLFGKGVLRLRYKATGKKPSVWLAPGEPIPCPDGFDTVSVWIYGNKIWGKDDLAAEFSDASGKKFAIPMGVVRHSEWHCLVGVATPDQRELAKKGAKFLGFRLSIETSACTRTLDFTSLCIFRDPKRPLPVAPRARRGVQLFADQDQGHNTGSGILPFPNRVDTVVPPRRDVPGLEFRLPDDDSLDWGRLAFRIDGGEWIPLACGGGLSPALAAKGAKVRFSQKGNSVVATVEAPAGVREVSFGAAALPAGSAVVGWPYYTFTWCDRHDIPGYEKGGPYKPKTAVVKVGDRKLAVSAMFDWTQSSAFAPSCRDEAKSGESQLCCSLLYVPRTDGVMNRVFERLVWTVAEKVEDVFPSLPNPESPWKRVTGSNVWRANPAVGDRSFNREYWKRVKALGIDHLVVTDHETGWRDGNESFTFRTRTAPARGGDASQKAYARFMTDEMGYYYGPYSGLCDFQPVNTFWSIDRVARRWDGTLVQGWQRCYAPKSTWAVAMGERLPPEIQAKFGFNTAYCDVHTCKSAWQCADCDSRAPGAATFAQAFYDFGEIMLLQKKAWGGPVYSEGGFHWWYCGLVDGNYAQDYTYDMCDSAWLVDFDLARLHDKCCNFGMGSPKMFYRKLKRKPDPVKEREEYLMRFIAATLAYGHSGYLACVCDPVNSGCRADDLECEEVSYFLVQGIAAKYTQASAVSVRYADSAGKLVDSAEAILSGAVEMSQLKVVYSDGTEVAVNGNRERRFRVSVKGSEYDLPPNGWVAVSGDGKAGSMNVSERGVPLQRAWSSEYEFVRRGGKVTKKSLRGAAGADLPPEEPYGFRKRLSVVHEENRRDASAVPGEDDFAFIDGAGVALAADASALARRAAGDFLEYLAVSMGVKTGETAAVSVAFDKSLGKGRYVVDVGDTVAITAFDDRAAAQALYHLEDAMNLRRAPFLAKGRETRGARFSPRLAHSGFKCDVFPDEHLRALSHAGIDAILIYLGAPGLCKVEHRKDVRDTMQRALAWGIDTYIYSQVNGWKHPDDPDAEEFFDSRYGKLVAAYPEAKGFVVVDENCRFPSKDPRVAAWDEKTRKPIDPNDPRPAPGYFPSSDYPAWFGRIRSAINKVNPDVELVFWAYAFCWQPIENAVGFVDILPKDVTLNVTFEMSGAHEKRNGMKSVVEDYSLSFEGPGRYFRDMAAAARRNGLRLYTMANSAGLAWDWGTIPYEPCPYQWKRRWDGVVAAHGDYGVTGVMESHHYGVWPSFITELEKEAYTDGGYPFDWHVRKIAERDFGEENADAALEAWRSLSDAVRDVPPTYENQYGPFRIGPAFPFCAFRPTLDVSKLPFKPMYLGRYWQQMRSRIYAPNDWLGRDHDKADYINRELELLRGVADRFLAAGRTFRSIAEDVVLDPARRAKAMRLSYLTEYMGRGALTALHTREAVWLEHGVKHLGVKGEKERRARARVDEIARAEYENTLAALEIMKRDSRLGWEPTMDYRGGNKTLEWKLGYLLENYPVK